MRIVFAGTPAPAVLTLKALIASDHEVVGVITRPPARTGRGRTLSPSPVAVTATAAGLNLLETSSFTDEKIQERVADLEADVGVVVAYGALIPQRVLETPRLGWINLHFSDLPRWRGAAPVQWAILSGDERTGSCVFQLEAGLDTGPVFSRLVVPIGRENSGELLERMAELGAAQVVDVVDALAAGTARAVAQDENTTRITHARRLTHEDGFIDFTDSAAEVDQRIRAVTPNPGAWTTLPGGTRMKIGAVEPVDANLDPGRLAVTKRSVDVGCAEGAVRLLTVAPAGKGWMDGAAWARGARLAEDSRLGAREEH